MSSATLPPLGAESIAEAVRFIVSSEPKEITGRVDNIQCFMKELELQPVELIG